MLDIEKKILKKKKYTEITHQNKKNEKSLGNRVLQFTYVVTAVKYVSLLSFYE